MKNNTTGTLQSTRTVCIDELEKSGRQEGTIDVVLLPQLEEMLVCSVLREEWQKPKALMCKENEKERDDRMQNCGFFILKRSKPSGSFV